METLSIIADICSIFSCLFLAYMLIDAVCCEIRIRRATKKHRPQDEYVIEGAADCFDLTDCQPEKPSPLISKNSISELKIGDTRKFAKLLLDEHDYYDSILSMNERNSVILLLSAYIQYLLVNAPFNEHNFYTLFMMLENSLMAEENDETDLAAGLLAKDSQNYRFTEGFFYGEYLFFEKICSDKKKAVKISKKLIEDVCDDLDIEIHED